MVSSIRTYSTCFLMKWDDRIRSVLALAQGAKEYNLVRPRVTLENTIQIESGRYVFISE